MDDIWNLFLKVTFVSSILNEVLQKIPMFEDRKDQKDLQVSAGTISELDRQWDWHWLPIAVIFTLVLH